jgi:hypothetical protein
MFDPSNSEKMKSEKMEKKRLTKTLKDMVLNEVPKDIHAGLLVNVKEIVCGDPACAPIDTVVTMVWESGGRCVHVISYNVQ